MVSKDGQTLRDTKISATNVFKTSSKRAIQKTVEAASDLVGMKIVQKTAKASSKSTRENPRKLTATQIDKTSVQPTVITKERYIPQENRNKSLINSIYYNFEYIGRK